MVAYGAASLARSMPRKRIETPLNKMTVKFFDPKIAVDAGRTWHSLYAEIITKQTGKQNR